MRSYDIKGDGRFGVDDLKALIPSPKDFPLDGDQEGLDLACTKAKIKFIEEEVEWKLKGLTAKSSAPSRSPLLFGEIESIRKEALHRIQDLSGREELGMAKRVRSSVVEMALRAQNIVKDETTDEPFGTGLYIMPLETSPTNWRAKIIDVYPDSAAAAAGILSGDILLAVDGRPIQQWSPDGTFAGLNDPETQIIRGLGGPRNTEVRLSLQRGDQKFDVTVRRNTWSARHLGTPRNGSPWDGQEHTQPPMGLQTQENLQSPSFGCSFYPGSRP